MFVHDLVVAIIFIKYGPNLGGPGAIIIAIHVSRTNKQKITAIR